MSHKKRLAADNDMDPHFLRLRSEFSISAIIYDRSFEPVARNMEMWAWSLPTELEGGGPLNVITRETGRNNRVTGKGIRSHALHGVDNTGNVRVWV